MKLTVLIPFLAGLLMPSCTHAQQNTFPILADTPKWCMVSSNYNVRDPVYYYATFEYFYKKDTFVDGKNYAQLMGGFKKTLLGLVRQEGKKTFLRRIIPNQTPIAFTAEFLLYDFNMSSTNDSITVSTYVYYEADVNAYYAVVKFRSADSVVFNGVKRRRLKVTCRPTERSGGYFNKEWIEGYGDLNNPFYDCISCIEVRTNTMGLDIRGQRIYQDTTISNGCLPKRVGIHEPSAIHLTVSPNPTSGNMQITWDLAANTEGGTLRLFTTNGQLLQQQRLAPQTNAANLAAFALPNGLYFLSVNLLGYAPFVQKIVIAK